MDIVRRSVPRAAQTLAAESEYRLKTSSHGDGRPSIRISATAIAM